MNLNYIMILKRWIFLLFIPLLLTLIPIETGHASQNNEATETTQDAYHAITVKVGMPDFNFFSKKQEDGTYEGIICDYLDEIVKYTGWKLEYVEGEIGELTEMLIDGRIDIMGALLKNEYTEGLMDFAEYSSGYSYSTLNVKEDNTQFIAMDYSSFNNMTVGVFKNATNRISLLNTFCEANDISITPVYFDDFPSLFEAFEKGDINSYLTNDNSLRNNEKVIASFGAVPYYFAVTKGKKDILREVNTTLSTLIEINPQFENMLYNKYYKNLSNQSFTITKSEKDYIKNSGTLKVVSYPDFAPISYVDKNGEPCGIAIDVLKKIEQMTGLQFEYILADSYDHALTLINKGNADMIAGIYNNTLSQGDSPLTLSKSYLSTQTILIRNLSNLKKGQNIVALPKGINYSFIDPNSTIKNYKSLENCLREVIDGSANYTISDNLTVNQYMHLSSNRKLSLSPISNSTGELSLGIKNPTNPTLLSIIDKAIYKIPTEDIQQITFHHTTTKNYKISLNYLIHSNPLQFVIIILGICIIILFAALTVMRSRMRLSQQIALNSEAYRIIGELTDEYIFEFDYESKILRLPSEFAELIGQKSIIQVGKLQKEKDNTLLNLISLFELSNTPEPNTIEFKCKYINGKEEWFRAIGTIIYNPQKKPTRGIGKIINIESEIQEKLQLKKKADHDTVTGLFNKEYCLQSITNFFDFQTNAGKKGALLIIDLDHFKQVNDNLGHLAGDEVLKDLSKTLKAEFRQEDILGRWGGDEFIVFIEDIKTEDLIIERAKKLCNLMNKEFFYEGKSHFISISIGISFTDQNSTYDQLFKEADLALYVVKNGQRNDVKVYNEINKEF